MDNNQAQRGEEIMKAVYKASLQALFSIGVKSPQYVDAFSLHLTQSLDREFLKIGLFQPPKEEASFRDLTYKGKKITETKFTSIDKLNLRWLTKKWLKNA